MSKKVNVVFAAILVIAFAALVAGVFFDRQAKRLDIDQRSAGPTSVGALRGVATDAPTTFSVLGDGYSEGQGIAPGRGWAEQFASNMCWTLLSRSAQNDSGYAAAPASADAPAYTPFSQRIGDVTAGDPQVVVVQGGGDGPEATPAQISAAASEFFVSLRAALGDDTVIVAVGPVPTPLRDSLSLAPISAAISQAAISSNVKFVDPVAEDWLQSAEFFNEEQTFPNELGYGEFARRLEVSLRGLGIRAGSACN